MKYKTMKQYGFIMLSLLPVFGLTFVGARVLHVAAEVPGVLGVGALERRQLL